MFSGASFGEFGFSELPDTPLDTSAFQAFLEEVSSPRVWLLELDGFSLALVGTRSSAFGDAGFGELGFSDAEPSVAGGVQTMRFASQGYISHGSDSPAYMPYEPRLLVDSISVERSIASRSGIGGLTSLFAAVSLVNADGGLDLASGNYSFDGRRARILIGRDGDPLSSFGLVFTGVVAETPETQLDKFTLRLSDGAAKLDVPVNQTTYGGAGGLDGGADLKGKPKPRCWGHVYNVSPPLVDSATLTYQVNDGAISDVPNVYDRGIALAKVGGAPAAGEYQVNAAQGTFKLGAQPAGTVTCNVLGDASGAGYVNKAADIILRLLAIAGLNSSEIDPASFANLNTDAGAEIGLWRGPESATVGDAVDELLAGIGAFGGFSRYGAFTIGVVKAPSGVPAASFTEADIIDIRRVPRPPQVDPIIFRASVGYQKNYTPQTDLAAAVPAARVSFAAQEYRLSKSEDLAIRSRYLLAAEYGPVPAHYAQQADSDAEAARLFALWSGSAGQYELDLRPKALTRDLGQVVTVTHRRLGFSLGKPASVIGHRVNGAAVTLQVIA